jgi:peptidoglycan-associated lipoprotein
VKYSYILIMLLGFCHFTSAQPMRTITYDTKIKVADIAAQDGDYYGAIEWYSKAYEESKDLNLQLAIADLYMVVREYNKAERTYERILKRDKTKEYEDIRLDYARSLKSQGKYKEAYQELQTLLNDAETNDSLRLASTFEIDGIKLLENLAPNLEAIVAFLPGKVNSASAESAPIQGPDGALYYSSFNRKKELVLDGTEKDYQAKIFMADKNLKGEYDKVTPLPTTINRPDFHNGGIAFSRDGRRMYLTRVQLLNNLIEKTFLYVSNKTDGGWGAPVEIKKLNGDYIIKHPVVGELFGDEVLFFSSNMPGGQGGYDLYYSTINGENFSTPVNLGAVINSTKDEITPFYSNGTLYFSTNGKPTIGGFDIYYATWDGTNWKDATNIGFNYNSAYDDMFLKFNDSGTNGFLVSNRPSKEKLKMKGSESCCDDIYGVFIRDLVIDLQATIEDDAGALQGATVDVVDLTLASLPDSKTNLNNNVFSFPLLADHNYKTIIKKEGYFPDTITFNTNGILDDYTVKKTVKLKKDPNYKPKSDNDGNTNYETQTVTKNQTIRLNNIYYKYDDASIQPDAEQDLAVLLDLFEEYPDLVIELSSHTDARGNDNYNQKLSQRRADSAKSWLIDRGVDAKKIKAVGYGEKFILNKCTNNAKCSDEEHRFNRRTEFKMIGGPKTIEIKREIFKDNGGDRSVEDK